MRFISMPSVRLTLGWGTGLCLMMGGCPRNEAPSTNLPPLEAPAAPASPKSPPASPADDTAPAAPADPSLPPLPGTTPIDPSPAQPESPPSPPPAPAISTPTTGSISGVVAIAQQAASTRSGPPTARAVARWLTEVENNNSVDRAHCLGDIALGQAIVVHGFADATQDPFDGFALQIAERVGLAFELESTSSELDLLLYDRASAQFVQRWGRASTGSLIGKGLFDLVIHAAEGAAEYTLTIRATSAAPFASDDDVATASSEFFVAALAPGDTLALAGQAASAAGEVDQIVFSAPRSIVASVNLELTGGDADLSLLDATTAGIESAPTIQELQGFAGAPTGGDFALTGLGLYVLRIAPTHGDPRWTLTLSASRTDNDVAADLLAPLDLERHYVRGAPRAHYGLPSLPFTLGELLVAVAPGADVARFSRSLARLGAVAELPPTPISPLRARMPINAAWSEQDSKRRTLAAAAAIALLPGVRYAEPNFIRTAQRTPNDPFFSSQWHYPLMRLPQAWDITTGSADVIVAVIDSGITPNPDLIERVIPGMDFISNPSTSLDGDGIDADPTDPGDRSLPDGTSSFHGTHVAGTIGAATDNGLGVAGVTFATRVMPLRVLGVNGAGSDFDIANAILFSAGLPNSSGFVPAQRADVINMSLGGPGFSQTMADACRDARNAGVTIFAASGNENSPEPSSPAALPGVVSVGAVNSAKARAHYSNFGPTLDLMAPGGDTRVDTDRDGFVDGVLSTAAFDDTGSIEFGLQFEQGTSMACPHAAGVAALLLAVNPALQPAQIEQILIAAAEDLGLPGPDDQFGHGLIDAFAAVQAAQAASNDGGESTPPVLELSADVLEFPVGVDRQVINVSNAGGGILSLVGGSVATLSGGDWLSAAIRFVGDDRESAISAIVVDVDRAAATAGEHEGRIDLQTAGGNASIRVILRSSAPPATDNGVIAILLVDAATDEVVDGFDLGDDLSFVFDAAPVGRYLLVAGSDVDEDGLICEPGELCGEVGPLQVLPGTALSGVTVFISR